MNYLRNVIITLIVIVFFALPTLAQKDGDPVSIGMYRILHSEIINEDRTLLVNLPRGYDETTNSYPGNNETMVKQWGSD